MAVNRRGLLAAPLFAAALCLSGCAEDEFTIEGTWRSTGDGSWGLVSPGSVVAFDGTHCALFSPSDTYAFYKDGDHYRLNVTGILGSGANFTVDVIDNDNIELRSGSTPLSFTRVD